MSPRFLLLAAAALISLPGCSSDSTETDGSPEPAVGAAPASFAGTYHVAGRTVEKGTGKGRDIEGTVVIQQEGDAYTASFELTTLFPTPGGPTEAQVVGTGRGSLDGVELLGTADTQIILAQVPGVDVEFAFLPRQYGPRLTSRSVTRRNADGSLSIEIENDATEGQSYQATRTSMRGTPIERAR